MREPSPNFCSAFRGKNKPGQIEAKIVEKNMFGAPVKNTVFWGYSPPSLLGCRGSVWGMPGEGLAGGKSGFRIGGVAKSITIEQKSSKIGCGTPPETNKKNKKNKVTEKVIKNVIRKSDFFCKIYRHVRHSLILICTLMSSMGKIDQHFEKLI